MSSFRQNTGQGLTQSAVKSQSQKAKGGQALANFSDTGYGQVGRLQIVPLQLTALKSKGLLIAQPLPQSQESLCKQQAFGDSLCSASCWRSAPLLQNLDTALL